MCPWQFIHESREIVPTKFETPTIQSFGTKTPIERRVRSISYSLTKNKSFPSPIMIPLHFYVWFPLLFASLFLWRKLMSFMTCVLVRMMLLVRILFIDTSLHKPVDWFTEFSFAWGQAMSKLGGVDTSNLHHYFYIIVYCYSLIYFILWTWYLCYFLYIACLMIMRGITAGVRILLEKASSRHYIY